MPTEEVLPFAERFASPEQMDRPRTSGSDGSSVQGRPPR